MSDYNCPYCESSVGLMQIDHFLPKIDYPFLSLDPLNLVPCCSACNQRKSTITFECNNSESIFFNPYVDDFDDGTWLKATIQHGDFPDGLPPIVFSTTDKPDTWSDEKYMRLIFTFKNLKLADCYKNLWVSFMCSKKSMFSKGLKCKRQSKQLIQDCLDESGYYDIKNYWKTIGLEAALSDDRFLDIGFSSWLVSVPPQEGIRCLIFHILYKSN